MTRYLLVEIGMLVTLSFTGCTNELSHEEPESDHTLRLLSVSLNDEQVEANPLTKAEVTTGNITEVGLLVTKASGDSYYDTSNPTLTFTKSETGWSSSSTIELKQDPGDANAYAFYPATNASTSNESATPKMNVAVRSIHSFDLKNSTQSDYLYGVKTGIAPSKSAISIGLAHALTKISFRIDKPQNATDIHLAKLEILSPLSRLQAGNGTINLTSGTLDLPSSSSISLTKSGNELGTTITGSTDLLTLSADQSAANLSCLLAPMSGAESSLSFKLMVLVDGTLSGGTINAADLREFGTGTTSAEWLAGKHYIYHITVDKQKAILTGVKIEGWKSDSSQSINIDISN